MTIAAACITITVTAAFLTAGIAVADLVPAGFVLTNSARVGVPRSWLPTLATLKLAGAVGLIVGLLGFRAIGIAAGTGLVLFFVGAIIVHVRARVLSNIAFPGGYLLLSVASLASLIAH